MTVAQKKIVSREKIIANLITECRADFQREQILSSVIRAWFSANDCATCQMEKSEGLARAISAPPAGNLHLRLIASLCSFTLKDVEAAFENLIDAGRKCSEGAVYTPNFVIDYIINRCLSLYKSKGVPHLLDPACGSGGFLVRAATTLSSRYGISIERVLNQYIYGVDINPDAIECAGLAIELLCAQTNITPPVTSALLRCDDTLLSSKTKLLAELSIDFDGFDVVVTNPPYVKLQNLDSDYRKALCQAYPEFTFGSFSLATLFLVAGHRFLSPTGVLGYITQNNLFTSLSGEGVRDYLQKNRCVHSVVDFGHQKIFQDASAYTCLVFLNRDCNEYLHYGVCKDPKNQLIRTKDADLHKVKVTSLRKDKWRLAAPYHLRNLEKLERGGTPLGMLADIRVGFATLKDSVFLINDSPQYAEIEKELSVAAIKIANFDSETELKQNRMRVIRPYYKSGGKWKSYEVKALQEKFPHAYAHLKSHRAELDNRDKGKKPLPNFFEWGRSQGMEAPGPKLLTKTFNRGPHFLLDETDSLFCNGYAVKPKTTGSLFSPTIEIRLLQRILNSWVVDYYARLTSFQIEGNYQCYQKNFIERFSIPEISSTAADIILSLEGEELQTFICRIFCLELEEVLEVVLD